MKLLLLSGFLGTGKTTLLLEIAGKLTVDFKKIAIIENEMGEIGIDNKYLQLKGLEVQELFGGCVCCVLSVNLVSTLKRLDETLHPEVVILEPSGVARPKDIIDTLNRYMPAIKNISVATLVDAVRYRMLLEMMRPLVTAQIQAADIVVINKIDQVDDETIDYIRSSVARLNPKASINAVSAEEKTNLDAVLEQVRWEL
jgi:G3E family GTPase